MTLAEAQDKIAKLREALLAAVYVCEGVADAPDRPESVAPSYAASVVAQAREALAK